MAYLTNRTIYDVTKYGVVATNYQTGSVDVSKATSNTTALSDLISLIAASNDRGGTLYFPACRGASGKAYIFTGTIDLSASSSPINILGDGQANSMLVQYDADGSGQYPGIRYSAISGGTGTNVRGIAIHRHIGGGSQGVIDGNYYKMPTSHIAGNYGLFNCVGGNACCIEDVDVQGWSTGVYIGGKTGPMIFKNISIKRIAGYGIEIGEALSATYPYATDGQHQCAQDIEWIGGSIHAAWGGVLVHGGSSNAIRGLDIELDEDEIGNLPRGKYPAVYFKADQDSITGFTLDNITSGIKPDSGYQVTPNALYQFGSGANSVAGCVIIGGTHTVKGNDITGVAMTGSCLRNVVIGGFWYGGLDHGSSADYFAELSGAGPDHNVFISPYMDNYRSGKNKINDSPEYYTASIGVDSTGVSINAGNGTVKLPALPTSSAGLASGSLWNSSGTVKVV